MSLPYSIAWTVARQRRTYHGAGWYVLPVTVVVAWWALAAGPVQALALAAAGGLATGLMLGIGESASRLDRIVPPIVVILPCALLAIGFSGPDEGVGEVAVACLVLFATWVVTIELGHVAARRLRLGDPPMSSSPLGDELDEATDGATVSVVVREYEDDVAGRHHLAEDDRLLVHAGYRQLFVERQAPSRGVVAAGAALSLAFGVGDAPRAPLVAAFRRAEVSADTAADVLSRHVRRGPT